MDGGNVNKILNTWKNNAATEINTSKNLEYIGFQKEKTKL